MQIARTALGELSGKTILGTDGKPIIANGATLTYFSGTQGQRNDHNLYVVTPGVYDRRVSENAGANVLVPVQDGMARNGREQDKLTLLKTPNGSAETVCPECLLIGAPVGSVAKGVAESIASRVIAPGGDIAIQGKDVLINAGYDTVANAEHATSSQVAIGDSVSMPAVGAVQGLAHLASAAKDTSNGRMQALAAVTAGMQAPETVSAAQALANGSTGGIKISVSLGSTKSETRSAQNASNAVGAQVAAGGNVSIVATGAGHDSNLNVIGSEISAGKKVVLAADNDVNLLAAENTASQHSSNSARGVNVGVGFALGGTQQGVTLELGANKARGQADGADLSHSNTHVTGNTVLVQSGGDTSLKGGVIAAETVRANIGGKLIIQSLQDRSTYGAKQSSAGVNASLCLPPFCHGASTVSKRSGSAITVRLILAMN